MVAAAVGGDRIVYGLVSSEVTRVSVLGEGSERFDTTTTERAGVPGRFFAVTVPNQGQIELVGYDDSGAERARIGSREPPDHKPLSRDEAIAQGDPAGFAPTVAPVGSIVYEGQRVPADEVPDHHLSCVDTAREVRCYDTAEELGAAEGVPVGPPPLDDGAGR